MYFENTEVWGFEHAIRGARNPLESWAKSDSYYSEDSGFILGEADLDLMKRLNNAGQVSHRKYLRQIFVSTDITAPIYFFQEWDTYKVATTANSTSKMHKLSSTPITIDCFEMDDYDGSLKMYDKEPYNIDEYTADMWESIVCYCETLRKRYLETKDKRYWKELIRILPESWLQTRTWTGNYEVVRNMYHDRCGHKLQEWSETFVNWVKTLPYAQELIIGEEG